MEKGGTILHQKLQWWFFHSQKFPLRGQIVRLEGQKLISGEEGIMQLRGVQRETLSRKEDIGVCKMHMLEMNDTFYV